MSKQRETTTKKPALKPVCRIGEIQEFTLTSNGMRVLFVPRTETGVVTSNIVYTVGSRDELPGETGLAHMLEHMLFKPTTFDYARKSTPLSMRFEREYGVILNANTWKDRTCYYYSYPKEHIDIAFQIEAERMRGVVLSDKEFVPERTNVLSEFDMYAGSEDFVLSVQMAGVAFQSHPYGHETIGYREDIEAYTPEKLDRFYRTHYAPEHATLIVVGDITLHELSNKVVHHFAQLQKSGVPRERRVVVEPKQEGMRSVVIKKQSETQVYAIGVRHPGFPSSAWFETMVVFDLLAGGEDSVLHKALVDKGLASKIHTSLEYTYDENLGICFITLAKGTDHETMHDIVMKTIHALDQKSVAPYLKKIIPKVITAEISGRENGLSYAQELVEYVSAGAVHHFFDSEKILKEMTPKKVIERMRALFNPDQITRGYFIGTTQ